MLSKLFSNKGRTYIYGVCIAAVPTLIYFGLLPSDAAPVILPLILALLNVNKDEVAAPSEA